MELAYLYAPAQDLAAALPFYRETLGWEEAWRDGEATVAFSIPGSAVQVMVSTTAQPAGPMYRLPDLAGFLAERPDLEITIPPYAIPGGTVAGAVDPAGNAVYFFDQARR
jgi:predicted enzyme related to lactoylglutathione lyase